METKDEFKKLGHFWLPSEPDKRLQGVLSISDEGIVTLEIIGESVDEGISTLFNALKKGRNPNSTEQIEYTERIVGYIENEGQVTLDDCYLVGFHSQFHQPTYDLDKLSIFVDRAFIREEYGEGKIPRFKHFIFPVEGIKDWSGRSNFRPLECDEKHITMSYQVPRSIQLKLSNDMQLSIQFPYTYSSMENGITKKTYFRLFSPNERELNEFISVAEKIRLFLCFAINQSIPFDRTSVALSTHQANTGKPPLIDIYDSKCLYFEDAPKINRNMLFKFEKIQSNPELIVNKWIEVCEDIRPALDLYITAQKQQYLTQAFLNLMQGLEAYQKGVEAYQKRISGKKPREMILKERLMCLSEPLKDRFKSENMRDQWITDIKKARNQLTHRGKLESTETYGKLDGFITGCLQLFQINLLQLIGFSQEDIDSIV